MPCYKNVNARLLYIHAAMGCDISTYTYATSLRRLAMELDMTVDTVRHAIKVLERDGLLDVEIAPQPTPQTSPHRTPQRTPQRTPHITILKIKKNGTPNGTPNTTQNPTQNPTENPTENPTVKNKLNNKTTKKPTHTHDARVKEILKKTAQETLDLGSDEVAMLVEKFLQRQDLKGKTWEDDADMVSHCVSWIEKRLPRPGTKLRTRTSDHDARMEEYQRTEEEQKQATRQEKEAEEVERLKRWYHEAVMKKQTKEAETFKQELIKRKAI